MTQATEPADFQNLISQGLNCHYAGKVFGPARRVNDSELTTISGLVRLSPSVFGMEPWYLLQSPEICEPLSGTVERFTGGRYQGWKFSCTESPISRRWSSAENGWSVSVLPALMADQVGSIIT